MLVFGLYVLGERFGWDDCLFFLRFFFRDILWMIWHQRGIAGCMYTYVGRGVVGDYWDQYLMANWFRHESIWWIYCNVYPYVLIVIVLIELSNSKSTYAYSYPTHIEKQPILPTTREKTLQTSQTLQNIQQNKLQQTHIITENSTLTKDYPQILLFGLRTVYIQSPNNHSIILLPHLFLTINPFFH